MSHVLLGMLPAARDAPLPPVALPPVVVEDVAMSDTLAERLRRHADAIQSRCPVEASDARNLAVEAARLERKAYDRAGATVLQGPWIERRPPGIHPHDTPPSAA